MRSRALLLLVTAGVVAAGAVGCRSALRDPGPLQALLDRAVDGASADAGSGAATAAGEGVAEALWARRTPPAVRAAVVRFLERAREDPDDVEGLLGAVRGWVWLGNRPGSTDPAGDARAAVRAGQLCLVRAPGDPRCAYRLATALGLQARERRSTALDGVDRMVELLRGAAATDPTLDRGGPQRVLALVYLRAPGWPTGPGDPDLGLEQARAASAIDPAYPPNALALAEALEAVEECAAARKAWTEAARLAAESDDPDAADWREEAAAGIRGLAEGFCG